MVRRRLMTFGAAVVLLTAACDGDDDEEAAADTGGAADAAGDVADEGGDATDDAADVSDEDGLAGTTVTVLGPLTGADAEAFSATFAAFESETGIDVVYTGSDSAEEDIFGAVEGGEPPDIFVFPQPGLLRVFAESGDLVDLGAFIEASELEAAYSDYLLSLVSDDAGTWGAWYKMDMKSLVWYAADDFSDAGYTVPADWDELIALSDQIVSDGGTPWCIGFGSGDATGWVGTDWIEDILLRTAGVEIYDQWVAHEIPFNHPEVKAAFELFGDIVFSDDYVLGGAASIATTDFRDAAAPMFEEPADCYFHRQASFIALFFPEDTEIGVDADIFVFPPIEDDVPQAILGGGTAFGMFNDRPEVRAFVEHMLTMEASVAFAAANPTYLSPLKDFDASDYPDALQATQGGAVAAALAADTFRFDASDLMPPAVGLGSFWTGMVDYVVDGPDNLDTILATIEASWPDD